jgi:hypothetical protein
MADDVRMADDVIWSILVKCFWRMADVSCKTKKDEKGNYLLLEDSNKLGHTEDSG